MPEFKIKKPVIKVKAVLCKSMGDETLDSYGYFLIRVNRGMLEVGLCGYDKVNVIKKAWKGRLPQDIYRRIIFEGDITQLDHAAYLGKELARAYLCLKLGIKYVQDGKANGDFTEPEFLKRMKAIE